MWKNALSLCTFLCACTVARAQSVDINGVVELWYTQMLSGNLRLDTPQTSRIDGAKGQPTYYQLNGAFLEDGFSVRRSEIYLSQKVNDQVSWTLMFDPNGSISNTAPTTLQDAYIVYALNPSWEFRLGQMKPLQTYEASVVSSSEILFYDRSQMARHFADKRDRGAVACYIWGDPASLSGRFNLGVFNGSTDRDSGKANDTNAQKDYVLRFQFGYGKEHRFGFYGRRTSTDTADKGGLVMNPFTCAGTYAPTAQQTLDSKDNSPNFGGWYYYEDSRFIANAEFIKGSLGRRYSSVGIAKPDPTVAVPNPSVPSALRQHLDQKFLGWEATIGYKMGRHTILARFDYMNYNDGSRYYGPYNPYTQYTSAGAGHAVGDPLGADYTPRFTETILGWNYALGSKWKNANIKIDYIRRSRNFLIPRPGQTGEQGGDSLVGVFKVGF